MKRVILLLVLAALSLTEINAQESAKSAEVDIRALVQKQIEEARKNLAKNGKKTTFQEVQIAQETRTAQKPDAEKPQLTQKQEEELAEIVAFLQKTKKNIWTKLTRLSPFKRKLLPYFLALELVLIGIILAVWYMRRNSGSANGNKKKYNLREVVSKMRSEKLIVNTTNSESSKLRGDLLTAPIRIDDGGRQITELAKKRGIAKGEIFLALKVRMLASKKGKAIFKA